MTYALELRNISKSFEHKHVLKDLSFAIEPGKVIGYIGPNGAGKSTTIKIIMGLINADQGEVFLNGEPIDFDDQNYKKQLGYVPEVADVFDVLTAVEYITFIAQLYGIEEADATAKAYELLTIIGLKDSADKRLNTFSKGMRQVVLLISALIHNPEIIFLDEPLNGIDANTVLVIEEILNELKHQGKTIFYSSHIMDVVQRLSDEILLLDDGQIKAHGTYQELSAAKSEQSLQSLFNDLTGFKEHGQKAVEFVNVITEGTAHEI